MVSVREEVLLVGVEVWVGEKVAAVVMVVVEM
jgi:hypothetical protein